LKITFRELIRTLDPRQSKKLVVNLGKEVPVAEAIKEDIEKLIKEDPNRHRNHACPKCDQFRFSWKYIGPNISPWKCSNCGYKNLHYPGGHEGFVEGWKRKTQNQSTKKVKGIRNKTSEERGAVIETSTDPVGKVEPTTSPDGEHYRYPYKD
jgi:hypothetical protein